MLSSNDWNIFNELYVFSATHLLRNHTVAINLGYVQIIERD